MHIIKTGLSRGNTSGENEPVLRGNLVVSVGITHKYWTSVKYHFTHNKRTGNYVVQMSSGIQIMVISAKPFPTHLDKKQ